MRADAGILAPNESTLFEQRIERLRQVIIGIDHRAIKAATAALSEATEDFAARRMDRNVSAALTGRRLADVSTD